MLADLRATARPWFHSQILGLGEHENMHGMLHPHPIPSRIELANPRRRRNVILHNISEAAKSYASYYFRKSSMTIAFQHGLCATLTTSY